MSIGMPAREDRVRMARQWDELITGEGWAAEDADRSDSRTPQRAWVARAVAAVDQPLPRSWTI
jgi:hypothetical protein